MERWLRSALAYVPQWLEFQMQVSEMPGCVVAIAHRNRVVLERAFGHADLATQQPLTPRHRFRAASHSKSFTAAGILKLREQGRLKLDDPVGAFVGKLNPAVARTTIAQLLSHSAGLIRDGEAMHLVQPGQHGNEIAPPAPASAPGGANWLKSAGKSDT